MAVPKHKVSKSKKRIRSSANFKATTNAMADCATCHTPKKPHCICGNCGHYKGVQRIESVQERKDKKAEAAKQAQ